MKTLFASLLALTLACTAGAQTTAPATQPVGRDWYVSAFPAAGATGLTQDSPVDQWTACNKARGGDRIHLRGGDTFRHLQVQKLTGGITFDAYGTDKAIVDDTSGGMLMAMMAGPITVQNIHFTDTSRNPTLPAFKPHVGQLGFSMLNSPGAKLTVDACDFEWFAFGLNVTSQNVGGQQVGTLIRNCKFKNLYGTNQRSEGIYAERQFGARIENCLFKVVGWYAGQQAANNQNHGIYWHGGDANTNGPVDIVLCRFIDCAAEGPTTNAGGGCDRCIIVNCGHDGVGMNAFLSGDNCYFTNNAIVGGFVNFIAKSGTASGNQFFSPGTLALNIDAPAKQPDWNRNGCTVTAANNLAFDFAGKSPANVGDPRGGRIVDGGGNLTLPASDVLKQAVIDAAMAE